MLYSYDKFRLDSFLQVYQMRSRTDGFSASALSPGLAVDTIKEIASCLVHRSLVLILAHLYYPEHLRMGNILGGPVETQCLQRK
jgi:SRSO17 transposase